MKKRISVRQQLVYKQQEADAIRLQLATANAECARLRTVNQQRLDTSMLEARTKLASQIGQLVDAVSKAVVYIVGKEQL